MESRAVARSQLCCKCNRSIRHLAELRRRGVARNRVKSCRSLRRLLIKSNEALYVSQALVPSAFINESARRRVDAYGLYYSSRAVTYVTARLL